MPYIYGLYYIMIFICVYPLCYITGRVTVYLSVICIPHVICIPSLLSVYLSVVCVPHVICIPLCYLCTSLCYMYRKREIGWTKITEDLMIRHTQNSELYVKLLFFYHYYVHSPLNLDSEAKIRERSVIREVWLVLEALHSAGCLV